MTDSNYFGIIVVINLLPTTEEQNDKLLICGLQEQRLNVLLELKQAKITGKCE